MRTWWREEHIKPAVAVTIATVATRFGLERSVQMTTNSVRAVAAWWSSAEPDAGQVEDVSGLGGQAVRLHFVMVAARLYSYQFV